ncbi:MAG: hypothetical protein HS111_24570 [Kofleriaceae bacterium]|nr:hypothetical protein [Kofleriaceae bacterium]
MGNVFVGHGAIDARTRRAAHRRGGHGRALGLQYALLVAALVRAGRRARR